MNAKAACGGGELSIEYLQRVASMLRLLAHPHRLKLVEALESLDEAPVHVLMERLQLPQAPTSQHLSLMRRVGLVEARRRGREVWYAIADRRCLGVLNCIRDKRSVA